MEAFYDLDTDKEKIENTVFKELSASVINNNRDFETMGIKLEDSVYDTKKNFRDELTEDPENESATIKAYYLKTNDGYTIKLNALNGTVQSIDIY